MNIFDAIRARRSIKKYDPSHCFTKEEEDLLITLAEQAPSSFNVQHVRLVKVGEPGIRKKICEAAWGQVQVTDASLLFVITADIKAWDKDPARYWRNAPEAVRGQILSQIKPFYEGKD